MTMAFKLLYLLPSIAIFFLSVSAQPNNDFTSQIQQINLKISHLESVIEESNAKLKEREVYLEECEKRINDMSQQIHNLQSTLSTIKADSLRAEERLKAQEEQVQLLWSTLRKNNFDLHVLKSQAQDTEEKIEEVTSRVETMGGIVTEQWIQVQHLEQALHIARMRALKAQRASFTRCALFKFINSVLSDFRAVELYILGEGTTVSSLISWYVDQFKRCSSMTKKYHHQLQGFIKDLMKKNELTASLANDEVVFFLTAYFQASALITFPLMSAWISTVLGSEADSDVTATPSSLVLFPMAMEETTWEQRLQALTHILTSPTNTPTLHSQLFIATQIPCYLKWDYPPILCPNPSLLKKWTLSFFLKRVFTMGIPQTSWRCKCPYQQPPPLILAKGVEEAQWGLEERKAYVRKRLATKKHLGINVNPLIPFLVPNVLLLSLMIWNPFHYLD
ncbi:hypothetical protein RIF29_41328 [Crotalaria pallida]|uniref:Uncharacterized protein n=1 Tax=Crotalaria pallida TaxID=3830 RepID=A0AAN9EAC2_CROPI